MAKISFVIPAYKESAFLIACIESLLNQSLSSEVILATSTPNYLIDSLARKYNLPLLINPNGGSIAQDWNFAIKQGSGDLIVLAHQDDLYHSEFAKYFVNFYVKNPSAGIIFSQINELTNDRIISNGKREHVKNILRKFAFGNNFIISEKKQYRRLLGLGCSIPCPAVAFSEVIAKNLLFTSDFTLNLDWDTWSKLAEKRVPFGYIPKPLMTHRIHEDAETQIGILDKRREKEDYEIFSRYWPKPIAKALLTVYKFGY
jgi:glycosyltransferase involved in cell wall biosynthesis